MNYRDTSNETSSVWSVDAIEDMAFIQAANKEAFANATLAQIGANYDETKMYVLWGCVRSVSGTTCTISAGAIYYRSAAAIAANLPGEIYTVDGVVFTVTSPNVAIAKVTATSDGDMRLFSDGNLLPVTMINKIVMSAGASGSGDANFSDLVYVTKIGASAKLSSPVTGFNTLNTFLSVIPSSTNNASRLKINFSGYCQNSAAGTNAVKVYVYIDSTLLKTFEMSVDAGGYVSFGGNLSTPYLAGQTISIQGETVVLNATLEELDLDCDS